MGELSRRDSKNRGPEVGAGIVSLENRPVGWTRVRRRMVNEKSGAKKEQTVWVLLTHVKDISL